MAHEQVVHSMCQGHTEASGSRAGLALGPRGNQSPCLRKAVGAAGARATRSSWDTATSTALFFSISARAMKLLWSCWQHHLGVVSGTSALRCEVCSPRHLATSRLWQAAARPGKLLSLTQSFTQAGWSSWGALAAGSVSLHSRIHKMQEPFGKKKWGHWFVFIYFHNNQRLLLLKTFPPSSTCPRMASPRRLAIKMFQRNSTLDSSSAPRPDPPVFAYTPCAAEELLLPTNLKRLILHLY